MKPRDVTAIRLLSQGITAPLAVDPASLVRALGAVQAQDYLASLWALGLRLRGATEATVESAIASRAVLRTWPMRGTIHFVAAEDARWMLALMAPRSIEAHRKRLLRDWELDEKTVARARKVLTRALSGAPPMPRAELYRRLDQAGIATAAQRGLHVVWRLAQEGLLCFGPRSGKQPTFVLLDDWVPGHRDLGRDEALAELARRYFATRGPATLNDFSWWTGLPIAELRPGLEAIEGELERGTIGGTACWFAGDAAAAAKRRRGAAHLLPPFDEYVIAYRDRSAVLDPAHVNAARHGIFGGIVVLDGRIAGTWNRAIAKGRVTLGTRWFGKPKKTQVAAVAATAERYGEFLGRPVLLGADAPPVPAPRR